MTDEKLERPEETCGLLITFEGGVGVKINLKAKKEEVVEKIQNWLSSDINTLIQFNTANPDEQEVCLFNPKKVLLALLKKEFIMTSGKIITAQQMAVPGANPNEYKQ